MILDGCVFMHITTHPLSTQHQQLIIISETTRPPKMYEFAQPSQGKGELRFERDA